MSSCARNRWGPGTTKEKPINSESAKELQLRMEAMNKERAKQDSIWVQSESSTTSVCSSTLVSTSNTFSTLATTNTGGYRITR